MMRKLRTTASRRALCAMSLFAAAVLGSGCSSTGMEPAPKVSGAVERPYYQVGPGDLLDVFVWRSDELSRKVKVGPDGRFTFPLIGEVDAAGHTASELAQEIETRLKPVVLEPVVTVMVTEFSGTFAQQVRVIGEAQKPQAIPFRDKMTVLDVMIAVGGLTEYASGNRAVVARSVGGQQQEYEVRLDDLVRDGDIGANVEMLPGDILIIPQRYL